MEKTHQLQEALNKLIPTNIKRELIPEREDVVLDKLGRYDSFKLCKKKKKNDFTWN